MTSDETRYKMSLAKKGKTWEQIYGIEQAEKIRKTKSEFMKGKQYALGNILTEETRKKMSEAHKGIKLSEETKRKISRKNKGIPKTAEQIKKISESRIGKTYEDLMGIEGAAKLKRKLSEIRKGRRGYWTGKTRSEAVKLKTSLSLIGNKNGLGYKHTQEAIQKIKMASTGRNNPHYGKKCYNTKRIIYKGIHFKSNWEFVYAKWLDKVGYHWEYEPKRFYFEEFTYLPDFWVDELKTYIEIKGFWRGKDKEKVQKFIESNRPLLIIEDIKEYIEVGT